MATEVAVVSPFVHPRRLSGFRGSKTSRRYETTPPSASLSERTTRSLYVPFGRRSFRAPTLETPTVGAVTSKSATPAHVLRKTIVAGSSRRPARRVLVHVPFPRRFASGPALATICQEPRPPCSAGSGATRAVNSPLEPAQVNFRSALSVSVSTLTSAAVPEGQPTTELVNVPSCSRAALCLPSKTSLNEAGAARDPPVAVAPAATRAATSTAPAVETSRLRFHAPMICGVGIFGHTTFVVLFGRRGWPASPKRTFGQVLDVVREASLVDGPEPFPEPVLDALRRLVPCDVVAYHERWGRSAKRIVWTGNPCGPTTPEVRDAGRRYEHQDPLTPVDGARKYSDFFSRREFHRMPLYQEVARPVGVEDMIRLWLDPQGDGDARLEFDQLTTKLPRARPRGTRRTASAPQTIPS